MKRFMHPKKQLTLIQRKDGRTYRKNWVYFRDILRHETDEKSWKRLATKITSIKASFSINLNNSKKKGNF